MTRALESNAALQRSLRTLPLPLELSDYRIERTNIVELGPHGVPRYAVFHRVLSIDFRNPEGPAQAVLTDRDIREYEFVHSPKEPASSEAP